MCKNCKCERHVKNDFAQYSIEKLESLLALNDEDLGALMRKNFELDYCILTEQRRSLNAIN